MAARFARDGKKRRVVRHHPNCRGKSQCGGACLNRHQQVPNIGLCGREFKIPPCDKKWSGAKRGTICFRCVPNKGRVEARMNNPRVVLRTMDTMPLRPAIRA